ncbi:MAG: MAE_28990/MAE_18760 family HEPN-like nuclease [Parafilimonas sp.]
MISVKQTFQSRVSEIETYFNFIDAFLLTNQNENLKKILKSNLILMLYNLIESTMANAVEEIHNDIHSNSVSFNALKLEIREEIISLLKKRNPLKFVNSINDLAIDIVKRSFRREETFSGNIDSSKIIDLSEVYGFSTRTVYAQTKNGQCLVEIKGKRNDLMHGTFSFTEIGKDYSIQDLEKMKREATCYLSEILDNIEYYLLNKGYLQPHAEVV